MQNLKIMMLNIKSIEFLAQKTSLSIKAVKKALYYIERKAWLKKRPDHAFLTRAEKRVEAGMMRIFKKQQDYFLKEIENYFKNKKSIETKILPDDFNQMVALMPGSEEIADLIESNASVAILKGGKYSIDTLELAKVGISFSLRNERAIQYLKNKREILLSNYKGSIDKTTRDSVLKILSEGLDKRDTYTEMAKKIQALSTVGVFSPARAELIAVKEVGQAYELGKFLPVDDFVRRTGKRAIKFWLTVGDNRVTKECRANEKASKDGIDYNLPFLSGDITTPRSKNFRCRCSTQYEIVY